MRYGVLPTLLIAIVAIAGCAGDRGETPIGESAVEEAYAVIDELYDREASDDEKLAATLAFLEEFPESDHTIQLVSDVVYFVGDKAGDLPGAVDYAEGIRSRVTDPEIGLALDRRLISWYGEAGRKGKMVAIAEQLDRDGISRFGDDMRVIEGAASMEEWELVREYCGKAGSKANAEAWRAEWPDEIATDEEAARAGLNRQGMVLVPDSWAMANLGNLEGALAGFGRADEMVHRSYLGVPDENLNLYWGRTLMMNGDHAGAMTKLASKALIAHDEAYASELLRAYTDLHGSEDGFDEWACRTRVEIARTADDFELPDYDGTRHHFADLRGTVTLLNFWSPT